MKTDMHLKQNTLRQNFLYVIIVCSVITCLVTISIFGHTTLRTGRSLMFVKKQNEDIEVVKRPPTPQCSNILTNITNGKWVLLPKKDNEKKYYDQLLVDYWRKSGIQESSYRDELMCGYFNPSKAPTNSTWEKVGSWCNPDSEQPCCNNKWKGTCSTPQASTCDCPLCVDSRDYKHAEISEWKGNDQRCVWSNYTGIQSCSVIENSKFNDFYFVGDSFVRNMFTTLLMLLTDDPVLDSVSDKLTEEQKNLCKSDKMYFWKTCRQLFTSINHIKYPEKLCGGNEPNFNITLKPFYNLRFKADFLTLIQGLIGKRGSLVILSIGFHMQCSSTTVIEEYLNPAVKAIEFYYLNSRASGQRWPQIYFHLPMPCGLLKPPVFFALQNDASIKKYSNEMKIYCKQHNITVLDFQALGKNVHSFDGTHYGKGVNLMKNQILLNYIASIS